MVGRLKDVRTEAEYDEAVLHASSAVVHFWAPWCEPCAHLDRVLEHLSEEYRAEFLRVEAEELTDVSLKLDVTVVPLFVFYQWRYSSTLQGGKVVDRLEGADVAALNAKVLKHCTASQGSLPTSNGSATPTRPAAGPQSKLHDDAAADASERVKAIVRSQPVVLLMKGTPDAPRCGFSSRVVAILRKLGVSFGSCDILADEAARQEAKVYADWPTFPQLYIRGEFVGGCDIVEEMQSTGELKELLCPAPSPASAAQPLEQRLQHLINSADVMLFMKRGVMELRQSSAWPTHRSPIPRAAIRAGLTTSSTMWILSKAVQVVQALSSLQIPFRTFDILEDQDVREGLKRLSDWPTYPQLYAGGELVGGCDIVLELHKQQQLRNEVETQIAARSAATVEKT